MSHTQSRSQRSDSTQYRKTNRSGGSNQQRHDKRNPPAKGGGGGGASSSISNSGSISSREYGGNAQGGQPSARNPNFESQAAAETFIKKGESDVLPASISSVSAAQKDTPNINVSRAVDSSMSAFSVTTSAPVSNTSTITFDSKPPAIPVKEDASRSFPLQFGSISPGIVGRFQVPKLHEIPARTSSAPPNLDEQKKSQASAEASRAAPSIPNPSLSKQRLLKKNVGNLAQTVSEEAHPTPEPKRDTQPPTAPLMNQSQKPAVRPNHTMPMQMSYHQPQVPLQFGGPSPQIQPQVLPGASINMPLPMHLPMGNPMMQQQIFIPGLQPHPMQPQGMIHQTQNFTLPSQMAHQMPTQLGNMGLNMGPNIGPHYSPQPPGKYGSSRKTVKITHPETHKELKLEGMPGPRAHFNATPQTQPVASYPPNHPVNVYSNSYNAASMFTPAVSSVSMNITQVPNTSQPEKISNQVTVKPPDPASITITSSYGEESCRPKREANPSSLISRSKTKPGTGTSILSLSSASTSASMVDSPPPSTRFAEEVEIGPIVPDSLNDRQKNGVHRQQDMVGDHPPNSLSFPTVDAEMPKSERTSSGTDLVSETASESPLTSTATVTELSSLMKPATGAIYVDKAFENVENKGLVVRESEHETTVMEEQGEAEICKNSKVDANNLGTSLESLDIDNIGRKSEQVVSSFSDESLCSKEEKKQQSICCSDDIVMDVTSVESTSGSGEITGSSTTESNCHVIGNQVSGSDTLPDVDDNISLEDTPVEIAVPTMKHQKGDGDKSSDYLLSPSTDSKDKITSDANLAKNVVLRVTKKKKEFFRKAEAAGASSDLYMAYKGPEEKKETGSTAEGMGKTSTSGTNLASAKISLSTDISNKKSAASKVEPDDWEDAAEISPQLKSPKSKDLNKGDETVSLTKKYSRDFLLKFVGECINRPEGFEVTSDVEDMLMASRFKNSRDSYPSPGRNIHGAPRLDYRASGLEDEEKWMKFSGPHTPGKGDLLGEIVYGTNAVGMRPGRPGSSGATRNQRQQMHLPYVGGIFSAPMQNLGPHGGLQRNYSDSERWQRSSGFQRGLMPSPQTPQQMMHKAEKKYEVGKITDEEEANQRQLKSILNKLTPQNFEKLFQQVKEVNIDNVVTLTGVISQIFDKALMEPTFCEMYANFCYHLAADLPDLTIDNEKITFKRLLLNKCQEEFEKREREEEEAIKAEEEGECKDTPEEREEKRIRVRRRMLGNIRLIGELYKKRMLTERIMHECINKLLGQHQNPDEENIEALCKLMSTIGEIIDHQKAKVHMDAYFQNMGKLSNNTNLSSRVRFMLKDTIDLRKNKWQQRRKVDGPKKIEEVHRDAAQERHTQSNWLGRSSSMSNSTRRGSHMEYAPRSPGVVPSSVGSHHVLPQLRSGSSQDVRMDEKHSYESVSIPVPLPQRPPSDDSITLGPQGGTRGMASRPQPSAPVVGLADISASGDMRGVNGFGPERSSFGHGADPNPKYVPERHVAPPNYHQLHTRELVSSNGNRESRVVNHILDRSRPISPLPQGAPESCYSEEYLKDKSSAAINEFYSAKDKNEVALCIKELNAPSFYPSMICIWVSDSFEQKDLQRDLLTDLLINLTKPQVGIFNVDHLIKGFESVLTLLEDAVTDAPRATMFLGRIFAKLIINDVLPFSEVAKLVHEGGEEPGRLIETGLAAEVMGNILNVIESEKGATFVKRIRSSSSIRLEGFRPPGSHQRSGLDKFI